MTCLATLIADAETVDARRPTAAPPCTGAERADHVREAIEAARLTLYRVSALTSRSRASPGGLGAITHTLYRDIRDGRLPSVHQLAALSRATRRPLASWFAIVGLDLSTLATLQIALHGERTIGLPAASVGAALDVARWRSLAGDRRRIERVIDRAETGDRTIERSRVLERRLQYFRIGASDPLLVSSLAIGSVVRVDTRQTRLARFGRRPAIYAVAHALGVSCCYVDAISTTEVVLFGSSRSRPLVCRLGQDAHVLGRVDVELRRTSEGRVDAPAGAASSARQPVSIAALEGPLTFGRLVRHSRLRAGLTFRDARALSERVAAEHGDDRFALSLGALSNYETLEALPGSLHALFSLAAIYAIEMRELLHAGGLRMDDVAETASWTSPFLTPDVACALGMPHADARDLYLWGLGQRQLDPRLSGAVVIAVDRHARRFAGDTPGGANEPPLFMLRLASDAYICCAASLHGSSVLVHPAPELGLGARCVPREHVEVMGRVSAIVRHLTR